MRRHPRRVTQADFRAQGRGFVRDVEKIMNRYNALEVKVHAAIDELKVSKVEHPAELARELALLEDRFRDSSPADLYPAVLSWRPKHERNQECDCEACHSH